MSARRRPDSSPEVYEWYESHSWSARCTATTRKGERCPKHAHRCDEPSEFEPPLCEWHRPENEHQRQVSARRAVETRLRHQA